MEKEQIREAYRIAKDYNKGPHGNRVTDYVQIGMQMALNGEVLYHENGRVIRID